MINRRKTADYAVLALIVVLLASFFYGLCLMPFTDFKTVFNPPPELDSTAQRAINALSHSRYAQLIELMPREAWPTRELFQHTALSVPQQKVVESFYSYYGWRSITSLIDDAKDSRHRLQIAHRYEGVPGYGVYTLEFSETNGNYNLRSIYFAISAADENDLVKFPYDHRPIGAWLWLLAVPAITIFQLITLISIFRSHVAHKWLWYALAILSVGRWTLNWSTGEVESAIGIRLLGLGVSKSGLFHPWLVTLALPIGAILYWILLKKLQQRAAILPSRDLSNSEAERANY